MTKLFNFGRCGRGILAVRSEFEVTLLLFLSEIQISQRQSGP